MNLNDICAFCGKLAVTDDHIPPKGLFPKPRPSNLITVRACEVCNASFKLDDEYFRDAMLTGIDEQRFPKAMALSIRKIEELGTNSKKRGYGWATYKSRRIVEVRTPTGIYLGHAPVVEVRTPTGIYLGHAPARELDCARLLRSAEKCVRGLYFHHFQQRVPDDCEVTVHYQDDLEPDSVEQFLSHGHWSAPQNIGDDAFVYWFTRVPDEPISFWILDFYEHHRFLGIIDRFENGEGTE